MSDEQLKKEQSEVREGILEMLAHEEDGSRSSEKRTLTYHAKPG